MTRCTGLACILLVAAAHLTAGAGCNAGPDRTLVKESAEGAVFLDRLPTRGTTVKYSGPLKTFHATHPVAIAPDVLARVFGGVRLSSADEPAAEAANLFTPEETWFLAQAVAAALTQASPDQRVRFRLGPEHAVTEGVLHVDQPVLRLALSRYRSSPDRHGEGLSTSVLSFAPRAAVVGTDGPQSWMQIEPDHPRIAIDYELIRSMPELTQPPPKPATPSPSQSDAPRSTFGSAGHVGASPSDPASDELRTMKELVVKQAQELQALKAELETLRQRVAEQESALKAKPKPPARSQP